LNYRHAFHAGNFADLVKHAALLRLLALMRQAAPALTVIDTHAGSGLYELAGEAARKSGEAEAGIGRLMREAEPPPAFAPLVDAVRRANPKGALKYYPGSPWLIAEGLRPADRYLACELNADEHRRLSELLRGRRGAEARLGDGFKLAAAGARPGALLVLIDPPFEKSDDYARAVETAAAVRRRNPQAVVAIWLPLKDLETFDAFLRDLEDAGAGPALIAETRLQPLDNPLKMNGCALAIVGAPAELDATLEAACRWVAETLGDGGEGRVWRLPGGDEFR
jgi:23S rRNA (adenine2030-N6)-methyltransferase